MFVSLGYALLTLAILLIVFVVVSRARGLLFALAATVVTFVGMFALFVVMVTLITSRM